MQRKANAPMTERDEPLSRCCSIEPHTTLTDALGRIAVSSAGDVPVGALVRRRSEGAKPFRRYIFAPPPVRRPRASNRLGGGRGRVTWLLKSFSNRAMEIRGW